MERETYALPCVKQIASGNLPYDSGNSSQGSMTAQRSEMGRDVGGMFKWEEILVNLWLMHVDVSQKLMQYCKAIILHLKINKFKKQQTNKKKKKKKTAMLNNHTELIFTSSLSVLTINPCPQNREDQDQVLLKPFGKVPVINCYVLSWFKI